MRPPCDWSWLGSARNIAGWSPLGVARGVAGWIPLSPLGLAILLSCTLGILVGGLRGLDIILLGAGAVMAILVLVLAMVVLIAAIVIRRCHTSPRSGTLDLESGVPTWTGFSLPQPQLPFLELRWTVESPVGIQVRLEERNGVLHETLLPSRRGLHPSIRRRFTLSDSIDLARVSWRTTQQTPIRILPRRGGSRALELLPGLQDGDDMPDPLGAPAGDRIDMRQYAPGHSMRLILWKTYARTRKLMVRVSERAITAHPRTCAYLVAGPGDEPSSGLARVIVERGLIGQAWGFGADGEAGATSDLRTALDWVAKSGMVPPDGGGTGLAPFLQAMERDGFANCLLCVPPQPGVWINAVRAACAGTRMRPHVLIATDGLPRGAASSDERIGPAVSAWRPPVTSGWRRLVFSTPANPPPRAEEIATVARALAGATRTQTWIDRGSGRNLGDPRLAARSAGL